jgi:hypothetical protein
MKEKKCSKCHETKDVCEFTKDKNKVDGLFLYCKTCKRWQKQLIKIHLKNTDRIKSRSNYELENREK